MKKTSRAKPVGFDKRRAERLVSALKAEKSFEAGIARVSGLFLGRPYVENPLGGGPRSPERFRISFDEFDCVTYVEIVIALARSKTPAAVVRELRGLRYRDGKVDWSRRNHYMIEWLARNRSRGAVKDLTRGRDTVVKTRELDIVAGFPATRVTFRLFPKRAFSRIRKRIRTGDLILFVSTRKNLDMFHAGIAVRLDDRVLLRHAARSAGKVIEQDLGTFLKEHRMPGFILARPLCQP
ncbi:MAG: N-acetylmuramoyl-L-alanine amidase-like domain-containing protein [Acidobacteriota bacterium]